MNVSLHSRQITWSARRLFKRFANYFKLKKMGGGVTCDALKIWTATAELSEESPWLLHPIGVETYIKEVGLHAH